MAATLLQEVSQDEHEKARLRSRKMYEMDRISDLLTAEERGEIKGEQKANEKWQIILTDKDMEIQRLRSQIADLKGSRRGE